jgi:uncharacterized protein YjbJ (UPF0337 family)
MRAVHAADGSWRQDMLNANERKGKLDQAEGRLKQAIGSLTGDADLKAKGTVDETIGKVEEAVGRATRMSSEALTQAVKNTK